MKQPFDLPGMQSRPFGARCGLPVAPFSIGAMRLPEKLDEAVELLRYAMDHGMRYIDTSRGYGDSEIKLGHALQDGYREKVWLSTKWAPWIMKVDSADDASADCTRRRIEESMRRLQVDYLDFYQVWNMHEESHYQQAIAPGNLLDGIRKAMDEGLVRHTGFTTHAPPELLLRWLEDCDWAEIMLVSYHLLNERYSEALHKARSKGIGTVVMNPVGGGLLAEESPVFRPLQVELDCAAMPEMALRYILAHPCIDTLIPGITRRSDVDSCLRAARQGPLSPAQADRLRALVKQLSPDETHFCTQCRYCLPCPQEVNIPHIMSSLHQHDFLGFKRSARDQYRWLERVPWAPGKRGASCTACGDCLERCTQQLDIPTLMARAHELFGEPESGEASTP